MGPPPPKIPSSSADSPSQSLTLDELSISAIAKASMRPPPPKFQPTVPLNSSPASGSDPSTEASESSAVHAGTNLTHLLKNQSAGARYLIPWWSEPPCHSFYLEVLEDGSIIDRLDIMVEIENLEETLNESIQESIGARSGRVAHNSKKGVIENEEEYFSDDDDFYDRMKRHSIQQAGETQSIETADSLLEKKEAIIKDMEENMKSLSIEKNKIVSEIEDGDAVGDKLDAYMSGLSSQLVHDKALQLEKELSTLQADLDRIVYLLRIADPAGETARKWYSKVQEPKPKKSEIPSSSTVKQPPIEQKKRSEVEQAAEVVIQKQRTSDATMESSKKPEAKNTQDARESKTTAYTVVMPQWLGAVDKKVEDTPQEAALIDTHESNEFVDSKDRKKTLGVVDDVQDKMELGIDNAAPGLIIRKRKEVAKSEDGDDKTPKQSTPSSLGANIMAEDAVALLLKHSRGYRASEEETSHESQDMSAGNHSSKGKKKPKRVLGPERPSFLVSGSDYETWVPPEGKYN